MTAKARGSCQCGAVTFEIDGEFDGFFLCHCSRCRKDTGSAHAANLFSQSASLAWLSGRDRVSTYTVVGTRHQKAFCSRCGSALPREPGSGEALVVPAGSIDGDPCIRAQAHIFYASRAVWDDHLDNVPKYDTLPGGWPRKGSG